MVQLPVGDGCRWLRLEGGVDLHLPPGAERERIRAAEVSRVVQTLLPWSLETITPSSEWMTTSLELDEPDEVIVALALPISSDRFIAFAVDMTLEVSAPRATSWLKPVPL